MRDLSTRHGEWQAEASRHRPGPNVQLDHSGLDLN